MPRAGDPQYDDVQSSADPTKISWVVKDATGTGTASKEITLDVLAAIIGGLSVAAWGSITGTLSSQTDLNSALAGKQTADVTLTALAALDSTAGILEQTGADTFVKRAIGVGASTSIPTRADADARYQLLDITLTALAGLDATAGVVEQTGADTFTKRAIGVGASTSIPTRADADSRYALVGASQVPTFANMTNTVFTITDGVSVDINPANGAIQVWTLTANRTPVAPTAFSAGQSVTLMIADGTSAYTVTWSSVGVVWVGGSAPTLPTSGYAVIVLWKVGSTIYGSKVGDVA